MSRVDANEFFANFSNLAKLKNQSQKDPDAALKKVAQEFESIFINMMFKNMRSANENIGSDLFSSSQMKQYQEMMDSQIAQNLAHSGGIGLADALTRQLSGGRLSGGSRSESSLGKDPNSDWLSQLNKIDSGHLNLLLRQAKENVESSASAESENTAPSTTNYVAAKEVVFKTPEEFVDRLWPYAKKAGESLGVDPKAILAQAALETGWGKYPIARENGAASFNLFGIKADSRWSGDRAIVNTLEYRDGIAKKERASFRAYDSFEQSFTDYADFLSSSERYKDALLAGDNAAMFAAYLQKGGYATDPNYADKIQNVLSSEWFRKL